MRESISLRFSASGLPKTVIDPDVGSRIPRIIEIVEVFPAPFGPKSPRISPGAMENEMSRTASSPSYVFVKFFTSRIFSLIRVGLWKHIFFHSDSSTAFFPRRARQKWIIQILFFRYFQRRTRLLRSANAPDEPNAGNIGYERKRRLLPSFTHNNNCRGRKPIRDICLRHGKLPAKDIFGPPVIFQRIKPPMGKRNADCAAPQRNRMRIRNDDSAIFYSIRFPNPAMKNLCGPLRMCGP